MGKKKSLDESASAGDKSINEGEDKVAFEDKMKYVSVIAKPMASKKLTKKVK